MEQGDEHPKPKNKLDLGSDIFSCEKNNHVLVQILYAGRDPGFGPGLEDLSPCLVLELPGNLSPESIAANESLAPMAMA